MPVIQIGPERDCIPAGRSLPTSPGSQAAPAAAGSTGSTKQAQCAVLGVRIPYLPDFLTDQTLVGSSDSERLAEWLERQVQLVANLWRWQTAAFSLRFIYRPERAGIEIALLARLRGAAGTVQGMATELERDLTGLLQTFGLPVDSLEFKDELTALRSPLAQPHIVELRQREALVRFPWLNRDAYVVYPFWEPAWAFLQPFEALLRQRVPCMINLHIEPTRLADKESHELARVAAVAQTVSEHQRQAYDAESTGRWADPQATLVARIYAAQLRRLGQPFLVLAQVASEDLLAAVSVSQAVGAALVARPRHQSDEGLVSAFDAAYPRDADDVSAAASTLHDLVLRPWGNTPASPNLARLRYLADARGAAALFRFPVAVRGGVPGIEVRQPMPDFESGARVIQAAPGQLYLGDLQRGGVVTMPIEKLAQHGLVAGLPGSGKTNTCLYLLSQLARCGIPFLVIEPAKTEYRGLIRQKDTQDTLVFTLGDETTAPFRLNPFELQPGVRLEAHAEALNVAINAAFPQFGELPTIIEEALDAIYSALGWKLTDVGPEADGSADGRRLFPTMAEFQRAAIDAVEARGYSREFHDNIRGAVKSRIGSFLRGSKGRMFNCRRSVSPDILFGRPVVLELDSLSDDVKAMTTMFLLIMLREYRKVRGEGSLQHLLLLEEAHRIMENVAAAGNPEILADTRARTVRAMTDFLVEMRAYGQGVLIAEQSPEKLAPDAVRNTNLKIAHMLPGRRDREVLASAMMMDEAQERFIGKLEVGQAAVFMTGFEKATFMKVRNYKEESGFKGLSDAVVREHMITFYSAHPMALRPFDGCRYCGMPCAHREAIEPVTRQPEMAERFKRAMSSSSDVAETWKRVALVCRAAANQAGLAGNLEAAYCYLAHEADFPFTKLMRGSFISAIEALPSTGANG
jgi:hypothetical protein